MTEQKSFDGLYQQSLHWITQDSKYSESKFNSPLFALLHTRASQLGLKHLIPMHPARPGLRWAAKPRGSKMWCMYTNIQIYKFFSKYSFNTMWQRPEFWHFFEIEKQRVIWCQGLKQKSQARFDSHPAIFDAVQSAFLFLCIFLQSNPIFPIQSNFYSVARRF